MTPKTNNRSGANRRVTQNKAPRNGRINQITDYKSYKGMGIRRFVLPGNPQIYNTTVTTGVINAAYSVNPTASVNAWSTRFGNTFDEWRCVKCDMEIIPIGLNTGITSFFWSEESIGSITLTEATERDAMFVKNNEQRPKNLVMTWRNEDFTDDTFRGVGTSFTCSLLNIYTDGTNFGSPVTVTPLYMIRPLFTVEFRGLAST